MRLPGPPLPQRHLQPGELLVTQQPLWVLTLLGSCVAVTMFSARFRLAAICHAMLPQPHENRPSAESSHHANRYLSQVLPVMVEQFNRRGATPPEVEVKMFGGGNVIHLGGEPHNDKTIGSLNIATAHSLLQGVHFRLKAENVGGNHGCKIWFNTQTGEVLHKSLAGATTLT